MQLEMAHIRQCGYAMDNEEHERGVRCIAAPIFDFSRNPIAAISVSAPVTRLDDSQIERIASARNECSGKHLLHAGHGARHMKPSPSALGPPDLSLKFSQKQHASNVCHDKENGSGT